MIASDPAAEKMPVAFALLQDLVFERDSTQSLGGFDDFEARLLFEFGIQLRCQTCKPWSELRVVLDGPTGIFELLYGKLKEAIGRGIGCVAPFSLDDLSRERVLLIKNKLLALLQS